MNNIISGVAVKHLIIHHDKRGFFCELIRRSDLFFKNIKFGQLSHSLIKTGVVKAWHMHKKQTDYIYTASGLIKLCLFDLRPKSKTYGKLMEFKLGTKGKSFVVKIPPGVAHGYKILKGPANIIYLMNREYDLQDEYRIPEDAEEINYDWKK